jgi:hypothetical protein
MRYLLFLCAFSVLLAPNLAAQSIPVALKKSFWPDAKGELSITQDGIAFTETNKERSRTWSYHDIQTIDRRSRTEFAILTYEDQWWKLSRDREYSFRVVSGELSDELFERIRDGLAKPVTDRIIGTLSGVEYRLPVKHLHSLGGCEGQLIFAPGAIYYQTEHAEDARVWRLASEVSSVWSDQPYELELHVYEQNRREFSRSRIFKFSLKERLDPDFYRDLKLRLYELQSAPVQVH